MTKIKDDIYQRYLVYFFLFIYVAVNLIYGFNEEATWDDDCPVRFIHTLNAFEDPKQFISVWNRPLFVVLFAPIVHLGKNSIFITMVLITAIGAYFLYKGIEKKGYKNSYMIIPFLLFQTYFFSISRNAETEPLAVALICIGFYLFVNKKWAWFALIGGLLPLARLELSVLLVFWGWYLLNNKQLKYIPLFLVPLFIWNIAGFIIEGDINYVYNATFGQDNSTNRYGHTTFGHYFQRYIYVLGPIIYLFFILGIGKRLTRLKFDFFVFLQFSAGFMLYVIFSWKLNMGNAAGFLRNLIPLTPFVAIFALEGYNWIEEIIKKDKSNENIKQKLIDKYKVNRISEEDYMKLNFKKRKLYKKELAKQEAELAKEKIAITKVLKTQQKKKRNSYLLLGTFVTFTILSTYFYHSFEIKSHHVLKETLNYLNLFWLLFAIAILLISYIVFYKRGFKLVIGTVMGIIMLVFTAYTEPPDFNMTSERYVMRDVAKWYKTSKINHNNTYANHPWFFWSGDMNMNKGFKTVTIENLNKAEEGDFCIYDTHYSHRLNGDVPKNWFENRIDWIELDRYISDNNAFHCVIYQKTDSTLKDSEIRLNNYISSNPNKPLSYFSRGNLNAKLNKENEAILDFTKAIKLDSSLSFCFENRAATFFKQNKMKEAAKDYNKAFDLNNNSYNSIHNAGVSYFRLKKYDSALICFNKALEIKPDLKNGLVNKTNILKIQNKTDEALQFYTTSINKKINVEFFLLERAQIYYNKADYEKCKKDLTSAISLNGKNAQAIFVRGVCNQNLGNKDEACKDYSKASTLGHQQAKSFYTANCEMLKL